MTIERLFWAGVIIVPIVLLVVYFSNRFREAEDTDQQFLKDISEVIASYTPFESREILAAYDEFGSWDKVIAACLYARNSGESLPSALRKVWRP
jgi:hypothetical protein